MRKVFKYTNALIAIIILASIAYGGYGFYNGSKDATELKNRAAKLRADDKGSAILGSKRIEYLLLVQDPQFYDHQGIDIKTPGAGLTTVTQSLSKRLAFDEFKPGIRKIRQTTYAMALESHLSKEEILTLFLDTIPMGNGGEGWTIGFFKASQSFFGKPVSDLSQDEFIELISVMIVPSQLNPKKRGKKFEERVSRINRLIEGQCRPIDNRDVWFKGCAD